MALSGTEITRLGPGILGARPRREFYSAEPPPTYSLSIIFAASSLLELTEGGAIGESISIAGTSGMTGIVLAHEEYIADGDIERDAFQSIFDLD